MTPQHDNANRIEYLPPCRYTRSPEIHELVAALAVAQGIIEGAAKDSANPFFKSSYADLASVWSAIRKPLSDNGLSVLQLPTASSAEVTITTILAHKSGQWVSSDLTITAKEDSPQAVGSAITYARRYALQSVVGVAPEDDDGEGAQGRRQTGPRPSASDHRKAATSPAKAQPSTASDGAPVPPELAKLFERIEKDPSQFVNAAKALEDGVVDRLGTVEGLKAYDAVADEFYARFPNGTSDVRELKTVLRKLHQIIETAPPRV